MSDLQCPARLLVRGVRPGVSRAADDHEETTREAKALVAERVVAVWAPPDLESEATAAAQPLGCAVTLRAEIDEGPATLRALREIADLHRGEAVLVLVRTAVLPTLLSAALGVPAAAVARTAAAGHLVRLSGDSDGWALDES